MLFRLLVASVSCIVLCTVVAALVGKRLEIIYALMWSVIAGARFVDDLKHRDLVTKSQFRREMSQLVLVYLTLLAAGFWAVSYGGVLLYGLRVA
jgi:hypothetical protein